LWAECRQACRHGAPSRWRRCRFARRWWTCGDTRGRHIHTGGTSRRLTSGSQSQGSPDLHLGRGYARKLGCCSAPRPVLPGAAAAEDCMLAGHGCAPARHIGAGHQVDGRRRSHRGEIDQQVLRSRLPRWQRRPCWARNAGGDAPDHDAIRRLPMRHDR